MKKKFILLFCTITIIANAQIPNWQWAESAGGTTSDLASALSTDASGNVYVTGWFDSPILTFGATTVNNAGYSDIFLTKYDAHGNVLWSKSAGGTQIDMVFGVSTDTFGNIYITGRFNSPTLIFDSITLTNSSGWNDIFLAKYDSNGNVLWAKSAGGSGEDVSRSVSTDPLGNVYITGAFVGSTSTFGSTTLSNSNAGYGDIFIAKYDPNGNVLWATGAGGTGDEESHSVSTDVSGNVYVAGYFASSALTFGSSTLTSVGGKDVFLTKYDPNGNVLWAKSAGGTNEDRAYGMSTDTSGNVYVTGNFFSASLSWGTMTLTNTGNHDIFTAKYDTNGNVLWAKSASGSDSDYAYSVSNDATGNAYVAGSFYSPTLTFDSTTINNVGYQDIFITKYDANGNVLWVKGIGGTNYEEANGVSTDALGNAHIAGRFSGTINFDSITLNSAGGNDIFTAKLCINTFSFQTISNCSEYIWNGNTYTVSGTYLDTIPNAVGCDSVMTLNLTINGGAFTQNIPFNNGDSIVVGTHTYTAVGTYVDTLVTASGCDSIVTTNLILPAGITLVSKEKAEMKVFPNPASTEIHISLYNIQKSDLYLISIYDITSNLIKTFTVEGNNETIILNTSEIRNGMYFCNVKNELNEVVVSKKFVVNR
ncbi:MAG: hypothetical protein JWO09_3668 [Bacteroidetes bacterium]|nr:hypothetical protein [Bacteroidota bacterium]